MRKIYWKAVGKILKVVSTAIGIVTYFIVMFIAPNWVSLPIVCIVFIIIVYSGYKMFAEEEKEKEDE